MNTSDMILIRSVLTTVKILGVSLVGWVIAHIQYPSIYSTLTVIVTVAVVVWIFLDVVDTMIEEKAVDGRANREESESEVGTADRPRA